MEAKIWEQVVEKWPSPIVARTEVHKFSGGLITARTLANLDSKKMGPAGRLRVGRKIAYTAVGLAEWLRARACKP